MGKLSPAPKIDQGRLTYEEIDRRLQDYFGKTDYLQTSYYLQISNLENDVDEVIKELEDAGYSVQIAEHHYLKVGLRWY